MNTLPTRRHAPLVRVLILAAAAALAAAPMTHAQQPPRTFWQDFNDAREPTRRVVYETHGKEKLHLDVFEPDGHEASGRRSCLLVFHGHDWVPIEDQAVGPLAFQFADRGFVGIAVQYRACTGAAGVTVLDCVRDARAAFRYVRDHATELGIDPDRIVVAGSSAGGHLALGTALFEVDEAGPCKPAAVVLLSAVVSLDARIGYQTGSGRLGADRQALCPTEQVRKDLPATLLLHGAADKTIPIEGARSFQRKMRAEGNLCELIETKGGGHRHFQESGSRFMEAVGQIQDFLATRGLADPRDKSRKTIDDQARHWPLGAVVRGWRQGKKPGDVPMIGHVVRSDERRLEVLFTETFGGQGGKVYKPRVLWVWERNLHGKSIEFENTIQRHVGAGDATQRLRIRGTVTLKDKRLVGDYAHDYRIGDGPITVVDDLRNVEFEVGP